MINVPFEIIDNPKDYAEDYRLDLAALNSLKDKAVYNQSVIQEAWDGKPMRELPVNLQPTAKSFTFVKDPQGVWRLTFITNLREQARMIVDALQAGFNTLPLFACDFNTFLLTSVFDGVLKVVEGEEMFMCESPQVNLVFDSRTKMEKLTPPGMGDGLMPKAVEEAGKLRNLLPDWCQVGVRLNTGPLSMACELRGADIFLDMFESPELYFHFMDILTDLYIDGRKALQDAAGYDYSSNLVHGDVPVHIPTKGILLCDDSMMLLSPQSYEKFLLPFHQKILDAFNGGCLHSCGDSTHLWPVLSGMERLHGFEFGQANLIDHVRARKVFGPERHLASLDSLFSYNTSSLEESINHTVSFLREGFATIILPDKNMLQELRKRF